MPAIAPAPMLERSTPSPSGPAPSTSRAKIVISAWLCPKTENAASITSTSGSTVLARTYLSPPMSSLRIDPRNGRTAIGGMRIARRPPMIAK